jgi:hypothetical protein
MTTETMLFIGMIILLAVLLPTWPYSRSWGYGPTGILTVVLVVFIFWALAGNRPLFRSSGQDVGQDIKELGRDAGQGVKEMGRDVGDSIKRTVR